MHNEKKPSTRITVERVSVTTIRTSSKKVYCEICLRSLRAEEMATLAIESRKVIQPPATASKTENEKGEIE